MKRERETYRCFYCDAVISPSNTEMDHFPIPQSAGGEVTVPACVTCHDLKDRFNLDVMGPDAFKSLQNDWPCLSRDSRIVLAKMVRLVIQGVAIISCDKK